MSARHDYIAQSGLAKCDQIAVVKRRSFNKCTVDGSAVGFGHVFDSVVLAAAPEQSMTARNRLVAEHNVIRCAATQSDFSGLYRKSCPVFYIFEA